MNIEAFFTLSYGLYIVSAARNNRFNGYIANTVFQVTAEPPQIAIACNKDNLTAQYIEESGFFSVSVLKKETKANIIGQFGYQSGKDINKFNNIDYSLEENGIPIVLEDCLSWFICKVNKKVDVGSHLLFIGEILNNYLIEKNGEPLTYAYYRDVKKGKAPKNAPTYQKEETPEKSKVRGQKYSCAVCGHIYNPEEGDPESGIKPGTLFEDLPEDWVCPVCGAEKENFEPIDD